VRERPPEPDGAVAPAGSMLTDGAAPTLGGLQSPETEFSRLTPPLYGPSGLGGPPMQTLDTPLTGGGAPDTPTPPSVPAPVPEPAAWTMMILGVFAVGALLRRGRARNRRLQPAE
jgi:hypothetical protein